MSDTTYRLLEGETLEPTGGMEIKGKGMMETYIWTPPTPTIQSNRSSKDYTNRDSMDEDGNHLLSQGR